ncbi:helix-turn-helix domain-containing protein [Schaalia sp. lx-100]|uniref:helix-turn-helix domain-containing protein n=1 Tax=Schaalia sp. lx-100 TaxID=2899081 RepID=UPI001E389735|nr:helix-turn-helix domain-containing protein [Schaalia sp. lx-100]MCD4557198.1 helix-turn-helix domain-containing protein [Schaalia sp. lx-100]
MSAATVQPEFYSVADTAVILGVSVWTVYRMVHRGDLRCRKTGRGKGNKLLISRRSIDQVGVSGNPRGPYRKAPL